MDGSTKISTVQLVSLLTVSSVTLMITSNAAQLGGNHLIDNLWSCLLALLCNFLLAIPLFFLMKNRSDCDLLLQSQSVGKALAIPAVLFYIAYFLLVDFQYLASFQFFLSNAFRPAVPAWVFAAMILIAAVYSAMKGLEAMGRTALIILTLFLLGILIIGGLLLPDLHGRNFTPFFYHGTGQFLHGTSFYLMGSTSVVTCSLLFPAAKGRRILGFCIWNIITCAVAAVVLFLIIGTLGNYASLQLFPFYTAATMAELGTFQRMDSVFICLWLIGLFLKLAIDIYCIALCVNQFFPKKTGNYVKPAAGMVILLGSVLIAGNHPLLALFLNPVLFLPLTVCAALLIPLAVLIGNRLRKRGGRSA